MVDTPESVDLSALTRNTAVVANALLTHIYNTSVHDILHNGLVSVSSCIISVCRLLISLFIK